MTPKKQQMRRRDSTGPLIGYAIGLNNQDFEIDCFGSPYELLEDLGRIGISFAEIAHHQATGITSTEIFKAAPQMEIRGGPCADVVLDLLDAVDGSEYRSVERIVGKHPEVLGGQDHNASVLLLSAIWAGRSDIAALFLRNGARPDGGSHLGMNPLHWAAALDEKEIGVQLVKAGADPRKLSWFFLTPTELANLNRNRGTEKAITTAARLKVSVTKRPSVNLVLARMME